MLYTLLKKHVLSKQSVTTGTPIASRIIQTVITFILIDFAWIFFRADSTSTAFSVIKSILSASNPWILFDGSLYGLGLDEKQFAALIISCIVLGVFDIAKHRDIRMIERLKAQPVWFRWTIYYIAIVAVIAFGAWGSAYNESAFIYFQF